MGLAIMVNGSEFAFERRIAHILADVYKTSTQRKKNLHTFPPCLFLLNSFLKQDECHVCPRCDISFSLSLKWGVKNCTFRIVLNHFFFQTFRLPQQDPT